MVREGLSTVTPELASECVKELTVRRPVRSVQAEPRANEAGHQTEIRLIGSRNRKKAAVAGI